MSNNYFPTNGFDMGGMGMNLPLWNPQSPQINRYNTLMQQQQQQQYNVQPSTQTNMNWVTVTNLQSAREQIVQPNSTIWMMDASLPQIYVKSVSNVGTIEFKAYKLVDIDDIAQNPNGGQLNGEFVPIDRFNKLEENFNVLQNKVAMYESLFQGQNVAKEEVKNSRRGGTNNESTK